MPYRRRRDKSRSRSRFALVRGKMTVYSVAYDGSHLLFAIEAEEPMRLAEHIILGIASLKGLHDRAPKA